MNTLDEALAVACGLINWLTDDEQGGPAAKSLLEYLKRQATRTRIGTTVFVLGIVVPGRAASTRSDLSNLMGNRLCGIWSIPFWHKLEGDQK